MTCTNLILHKLPVDGIWLLRANPCLLMTINRIEIKLQTL